MNIGWHDICIACKDIAASKAFYTALGMEVVHDSDDWVHLTNGNIHISLMTFLDSNWLNFRGADVSALQAQMRSAGIDAPGQAEAYSQDEEGSAGNHWQTKDPDGNVVYFDTATDEASKSKQVEHLLNDLERYLSTAGIETTTFSAFKAELEERYLNNSDDAQ